MIENGTFIATDDKGWEATFEPGQTFGHGLGNSHCTILCVSEAGSIAVISRSAFRQVIEQHISQLSRRLQAVSQLCPDLCTFAKEQQQHLLSSFTAVVFEAGQTITDTLHEDSRFFLIESGSVEVHIWDTTDPCSTTQVLAELGPGDSFGGVTLPHGNGRGAAVIARECVCCSVFDTDLVRKEMPLIP